MLKLQVKVTYAVFIISSVKEAFTTLYMNTILIGSDLFLYVATIQFMHAMC